MCLCGFVVVFVYFSELGQDITCMCARSCQTKKIYAMLKVCVKHNNKSVTVTRIKLCSFSKGAFVILCVWGRWWGCVLLLFFVFCFVCLFFQLKTIKLADIDLSLTVTGIF